MIKERAIKMAEKYGVVKALEKSFNITKKNINRIKVESVNEEKIQKYDFEKYTNHCIIYASNDEFENIVNELKENSIKVLDVKRGELE